MKRKSLILGIILFVVLAAGLCIMLESTAEYKVMNHSEQLKSQLKRERIIRTQSACDVRITRPWYSLDPKKWLYEATFGDPPETRYYTYKDGAFRESAS